jgi:hypothetical protein
MTDTTKGTPMIIYLNFSEYMGPASSKDATFAYAVAVDNALTAGTINPPLTTRCPECNDDFSDIGAARADYLHIITATTSDTTAVLVACEGYYVVDPNLVGIDAPGWSSAIDQDEMACVLEAEPSGEYPACANPTCDHRLCFMERRDLDECPACSHPIPVELRLENDMTTVRR